MGDSGRVLDHADSILMAKMRILYHLVLRLSSVPSSVSRDPGTIVKSEGCGARPTQKDVVSRWRTWCSRGVAETPSRPAFLIRSSMIDHENRKC